MDQCPRPDRPGPAGRLRRQDRSATVSVSYNGGAAVTVDTVVPATRNWNEYAVKPQNGDGSPSSPYRIGSGLSPERVQILTNAFLEFLDGRPATPDRVDQFLMPLLPERYSGERVSLDASCL